MVALRRCWWLWLVLPACAESHYVGSTASSGASSGYSPGRVPASQVRMYQIPPKEPFDEIGILEAREGLLSTGGGAAVLEDLREQAALRGCDAVVLVASADEVVGSVYGGPATGDVVVGDISTRKGYRGSCIVFRKAGSKSERERRRRADLRLVSRTWVDGHWTLRTGFGDEVLEVTVRGVPTADAGTIEVEVKSRRRVESATGELPALRHEGCALQLSMGNRGEASIAQTTFEPSDRHETWTGATNLETVAKMALGDEVAGTLCETRFRIGKESRAKLASFARLFQGESVAQESTQAVHEL